LLPQQLVVAPQPQLVVAPQPQLLPQVLQVSQQELQQFRLWNRAIIRCRQPCLQQQDVSQPHPQLLPQPPL
jgi:hypothetical protein